MTTSETNFSYRPISSLAIIAFAGGLIASISVITSWLLAALSIAFSLFALRSIYAADPRPAGTILAMIGFLLSIFWLCFSVTAYWTHRNQSNRSCATARGHTPQVPRPAALFLQEALWQL